MEQPKGALDWFVTEWLAALGAGDLTGAAKRLDDDVVWHGVREDFVCRGREEVVEMLRGAVTNGPRAEALELVGSEDVVVLGVRSPDLREIGGVALPGQLFNVYRLRDGAIVEVEDYATRGEAPRAAELAEPDWR